MKGYINSFESFGTKDGPGIRFIVFMQGCPLRCLYCHNVDTWDIRNENYIYTPEELMNEIQKVRAFLSGGVTASGGEPLLQADFLIEFFKLCHKEGIHTTLDTSGYLFNDKTKKLIAETDLFLLDLKHINPKKYKDLTSVELAPTLKFMKYLSKKNKPVWMRYVLVPGYTDAKEDLEDWADFVSKFDNVKRVDILPFHQMAIHKWDTVGLEYKLKDVLAPTKKQIKEAEKIFKNYGLSLYKEKK